MEELLLGESVVRVRVAPGEVEPATGSSRRWRRKGRDPDRRRGRLVVGPGRARPGRRGQPSAGDRRDLRVAAGDGQRPRVAVPVAHGRRTGGQAARGPSSASPERPSPASLRQRPARANGATAEAPDEAVRGRRAQAASTSGVADHARAADRAARADLHRRRRDGAPGAGRRGWRGRAAAGDVPRRLHADHLVHPRARAACSPSSTARRSPDPSGTGARSSPRSPAARAGAATSSRHSPRSP